MSNSPLDIYQNLVNKNKTTNEQLYSFPALDKIIKDDRPCLTEIAGDTDSLKTRFSYFLCNSLIEHKRLVYWIAASDPNPILRDLEVKQPQKFTYIFDNDINNLITILELLPDNCYIFLDSLTMMTAESNPYRERPYFFTGRILYYYSQLKNLKVFFTTSLNGITYKPLSYFFNDKIRHHIYLKKGLGRKEFFGISYITMSYYYTITINNFSQLLYAHINQPIDPLVGKFFWLVSLGIIQKEKRTFYHKSEKLGTDFLKIINNHHNLINTLVNNQLNT